MLVVDLSSFSRSFHFSSVVLAAPASSSAARCPNAVVAFVIFNNEAGATASLRRQMERFIERAAHGKLELHASSVLVLALQLVSQIPGFVVGSGQLA